MIYNATITNWRKRTGADAEGAPSYTAQAGSWLCCSEHGGSRFVTDPHQRAVPVQRTLRTDRTFDVAAGDRVTVEGVDYMVLSASVQPGPLRHLLLLLGSA